MTDDETVLSWVVNSRGVHRAGRYRIAVDAQFGEYCLEGTGMHPVIGTVEELKVLAQDHWDALTRWRRADQTGLYHGQWPPLTTKEPSFGRPGLERRTEGHGLADADCSQGTANMDSAPQRSPSSTSKSEPAT